MTIREIQRPKVGVGVCVLREGKILLGRRKGAHGAGNWSFAGGHLEFGESVEECAKRELNEETGLIAQSMRLGPWVNNIIEGKHYVTLFVFVNQFIGEPLLLEPEKCEGWHWFDSNQLPAPLFPSIVSLIQQNELKTFADFKKLSELSAHL